jgi:hypothetical protein
MVLVDDSSSGLCLAVDCAVRVIMYLPTFPMVCNLVGNDSEVLSVCDYHEKFCHWCIRVFTVFEFVL